MEIARTSAQQLRPGKGRRRELAVLRSVGPALLREAPRVPPRTAERVKEELESVLSAGIGGEEFA